MADLEGHNGDVVSVSLKPQQRETTFVTASVDKTVRLWDLRVVDNNGGGCQQVRSLDSSLERGERGER